MDIGIPIIGIAIIIACIMPFIVMNRNKKKSQNKILQSLTEVAEKHNCQIHQYEFCGDFLLGVDETKTYAFFYKNNSEKETIQYVNLSEIQHCKIHKIYRTDESSGGNSNLLERLYLRFIPTNKNKAEIDFECYNTEVKIQMLGELQTIEKWVKIISNLIVTKK